MKVEVKVPSVGESIMSGILSKWLKKNNDLVKEGEAIFELETDKVNVEVTSPAEGILQIISGEGDEVNIGQVVAYIDTVSNIKSLETNKKNSQERAKEPKEEKPEISIKNKTDIVQEESPAVRKIAGENKMNLKEITGSGKDGRITKGDLLNKLGEVKNDNRETVVKMSPMRNAIAKKLVQAKQVAAHLTTFNEINMEHVINIRTKYKDEFLNKYGIKLGFMSFFVKACCQALKEFKELNTFVRGNEIVYNHYYNIGIAVAVNEGLIVPVIKDADKMHFSEIEKKINELAVKARDKKITLEELQDGTFTITNGGIFGSMLSTPIPSFPQTAILGMHSIVDRPYVINGKIEIKPIMYAALTYDHRVIDGKEAVEFLVSIKKYIEDPESLLIEL